MFMRRGGWSVFSARKHGSEPILSIWGTSDGLHCCNPENLAPFVEAMEVPC